jgi:polysaccharide deacetylase family protein (PEP-CTERM system associated)
MSARPSIALTVDAEGSARSAAEGVATLLDLFDRHRAKATFFFLGELASDAPELVRTAAQRGHEIGFHGHRHVMLKTLSEASLRTELETWKQRLEQLSGTPVFGYRAPFFSLTRETSWALRSIADAGFAYDASIYPGPNDRYGWWGAPKRLVRVEGTELTVFPVPMLHSFVPVAFSGGAYLRLLPMSVISCGFVLLDRSDQPGMIYLHPWELDHDRERPGLKTLRNFRASLTSLPGRKRTRTRLEVLLGRLTGRLRTMKEVIDETREVPAWQPFGMRGERRSSERA